MKKLIAIIACFASLFSADKGSLNGELRAFSFDRSFDKENVPDSQAVTIGGIVRYTTPQIEHVSASIAYYGSFNTGLHHDNEGKASALLTAEGNDLSFIGEANLKFENDALKIIFGRQRLSTPLANDHDLRLLPSTYHGITAMHTPFGLQVGHITKYSGFGSKFDGFKDIDSFDFIYFSKFDINAQYIKSDARDYYYADYTKSCNTLTAKVQVGGNNNKFPNSDSSLFYGAKLSYLIGTTTLSVMSDVITGNNFYAIEAGPLFTDLMQGYGPYEPSHAYGGSISQAFGKSSITLTVVDVDGGIVDNYQEYQADGIYQINDTNKLRVRYSEKHQDPSSSREDRNDLRIIYYLAF